MDNNVRYKSYPMTLEEAIREYFICHPDVSDGFELLNNFFRERYELYNICPEINSEEVNLKELFGDDRDG